MINQLSNEIKGDANRKTIQPPMTDMLKAFNVPLNQIKAVILGQDPTPQPGKATGLAFSLKTGEDPSNVPSVFNMLVELKWEEMNVGLTNGDLTPWVGRGVLLLNAALTVRQGEAGSHSRVWQPFTELMVRYLSANAQPTAWILWGNEARRAAQVIDRSRHYIKEGGHPSPQAATTFFGGNYFKCANDFLTPRRGGGINWQLPARGSRPIEQC